MSRRDGRAQHCNGCANPGQVFRSRLINATGALLTFTVLLIVTITKFTHGAWLVFVIILALTLLVIRSSPYWVYYEGGAGGRT